MFTLKTRSKGINLSANRISADPDETQHNLAKRIAQIAKLPLDRLRVTFEASNIVLDKRSHRHSQPKVEDIEGAGTVLLIKDLGPFVSHNRN